MTISIDDVAELVRVQLGARSVRAEDRLLEDLAAESADVLNIVAAAEDRWGVVIGEEELIDLVTVTDLFEKIGQK